MAEKRALTQDEIALQQEQARVKAEHDRLMAVKIALTETTNTRGWAYIKKIAENIVETSLRNSLNTPEEVDSEHSRVEARIGRKLFGQMFGVIDSALSFGTESQPEWFSELSPFGGSDETRSE